MKLSCNQRISLKPAWAELGTAEPHWADKIQVVESMTTCILSADNNTTFMVFNLTPFYFLLHSSQTKLNLKMKFVTNLFF